MLWEKRAFGELVERASPSITYNSEPQNVSSADPYPVSIETRAHARSGTKSTIRHITLSSLLLSFSFVAHQCDCVLISLSCFLSALAGSTHCLFFCFFVFVLFSYLQPAQVTRFDLSYPGLTAANYLASLSFYLKCLWLCPWFLSLQLWGSSV